MLWVRGWRVFITACHFLSQTHGHTHTHRHAGEIGALSDPLDIAEDKDEQSPEEDGDDSGPDEDYNLHIGLVVWTLIERKKESHSRMQMLYLKQLYRAFPSPSCRGCYSISQTIDPHWNLHWTHQVVLNSLLINSAIHHESTSSKHIQLWIPSMKCPSSQLLWFSLWRAQQKADKTQLQWKVWEVKDYKSWREHVVCEEVSSRPSVFWGLSALKQACQWRASVSGFRCVVRLCVWVCVSPMTWTAAEEWTQPRWLQAVQV